MPRPRFLVDEAVRARLLRPVEEGDLLHPRHENNAQGGEGGLQAFADLYAARAPLHTDVHEDEIGTQPQTCLLRKL